MRLALTEEFLARGFKVDIVVESADGPLARQVPNGARVIDLQAPRARKALWKLSKYLRKERPAALISSMAHQGVIAALAGLLAFRRTPIFMTFHNFLGREIQDANDTNLPRLIRLLAPMCRAGICVSKGVAEDLIAVTGVHPTFVEVIYNPASPQPAQLEMPLAPDLRLPKQDFVVSIGRLVPQKNQHLLLEAMRLVNDVRPIDLVIVGEGPMKEELEAKCRSLGLEGRVRFVGYTGNPLPVVSQAKLFVLSSDYEGFGNVIVEALACGTPVVSTDCPYGPSEILDGGRFGRLTPVGNARALADAMLETLDVPPSRELLRARAADFGRAKIASEYLSMLDRRVNKCTVS